MILLFDKATNTETYEYDCNEICEIYRTHRFECDYNYDRDQCKINYNKKFIATREIGQMLISFISLDFDQVINNIADDIPKKFIIKKTSGEVYYTQTGMNDYLKTIHPFFTLNISKTRRSIYDEFFTSDNEYKIWLKSLLDPIFGMKTIIDECCRNPNFYYLYLNSNSKLFNYRTETNEISSKYLTYWLPNAFSVYPMPNEENTEYNEESSNIVSTVYSINLKYPVNKNNNIVRYLIESIVSACTTCLNIIYENGYRIHKCQNCGRYFITSRSEHKQKYCSLKSPQNPNKTCREYMTYMRYLAKTRTDEGTRLYKQIYNAKRNRMKRCENKKFKQDFSEFQILSKQWKADIQAGVKTEEEFIAWLKEVKEKKVL